MYPRRGTSNSDFFTRLQNFPFKHASPLYWPSLLVGSALAQSPNASNLNSSHSFASLPFPNAPASSHPHTGRLGRQWLSLASRNFPSIVASFPFPSPLSRFGIKSSFPRTTPCFPEQSHPPHCGWNGLPQLRTKLQQPDHTILLSSQKTPVPEREKATLLNLSSELFPALRRQAPRCASCHRAWRGHCPPGTRSCRRQSLGLPRPGQQTHTLLPPASRPSRNLFQRHVVNTAFPSLVCAYF